MTKKFTSVTPACFLAIAFHKLKKNFIDYEWLNNYRSKIQEQSKNQIDVNWDHDSINYTMGFFSPIFSSNDKGVTCNLIALARYYHDIIQEISNKKVELMENCAYFTSVNLI